ncbi:DUF2490 domain-containing protein [Flavobacterium silvaticum]|uniref:DUF2490 domain-containing protein n=1 Tax=Flavobacterium silvaticum TaxID=1852020 RepID=A0A972FNE7_9FLAO|nr:DUF2490 domain-containing protein [Flavobacterium silvaticum]NMH29236.1 DUF2490 domain-containing protein [Flavobacterium silvaticum]
MKKLLCVAMLLACPVFYGQSDLGAWYIYFGSIKPENSKWSFEPEIQFRNHDLGGDLQQLLVRPAIRYNLETNFSIAAGYAYVLSEAEETPDNPHRENRIYEEAILRQEVGRVAIRHRFRYEQRFMEDRDFNTRYRYCLFIDIPLNNTSIKEKTIYAALYNEIFINGKRNDDTPSVFDRDRIYLGAGYRLTKNFGIQLGWMNQMLEKTSKSQLMLSLHHTLPIRRANSGNPVPARG